MGSPRDLLHQLDVLVLLAEPTTSTIGPFLNDNISLLSSVLGLSAYELVALSTMRDEILIYLFGPALRQHRARRKEDLKIKKSEQTCGVTKQIRERTRWCGDKAELDVYLLLGPLLAGPQRYIIFTSPHFEVGIERSKLRETARALGRRDDLSAFVDPQGLHIRWRQGKGRLNFYPQPRSATANHALVIQLLGAPAQEQSSCAAQ